jgi:hypothetical protein
MPRNGQTQMAEQGPRALAGYHLEPHHGTRAMIDDAEHGLFAAIGHRQTGQVQCPDLVRLDARRCQVVQSSTQHAYLLCAAADDFMHPGLADCLAMAMVAIEVVGDLAATQPVRGQVQNGFAHPCGLAPRRRYRIGRIFYCGWRRRHRNVGVIGQARRLRHRRSKIRMESKRKIKA